MLDFYFKPLFRGRLLHIGMETATESDNLFILFLEK